MKRRLRFSIAFAVVLTMLLATAAFAHPDHATGEGSYSYQEDFVGEGVLAEKQHGSDSGHLAARNDNVRLVGKGAVTNPSGDGLTGRIADVAAKGNFAYLGAFREPSCKAGGVHVMDISDPTNPREVTSAFIPTTAGSYVGEGVQVLSIGVRRA